MASNFWVCGSERHCTSHVVSLAALVFDGQALFTACKLKVFDVLKEEGPLKAEDVARKVNASVCGTGQLLDVCVALGLLEKTDTGKGACEAS